MKKTRWVLVISSDAMGALPVSLGVGQGVVAPDTLREVTAAVASVIEDEVE